MKGSSAHSPQPQSLDRLVKIGLIRELFQQRKITQAQFEQLMKLQRA